MPLNRHGPGEGVVCAGWFPTPGRILDFPPGSSALMLERTQPTQCVLTPPNPSWCWGTHHNHAPILLSPGMSRSHPACAGLRGAEALTQAQDLLQAPGFSLLLSSMVLCHPPNLLCSHSTSRTQRTLQQGVCVSPTAPWHEGGCPLAMTSLLRTTYPGEGSCLEMSRPGALAALALLLFVSGLLISLPHLAGCWLWCTQCQGHVTALCPTQHCCSGDNWRKPCSSTNPEISSGSDNCQESWQGTMLHARTGMVPGSTAGAMPSPASRAAPTRTPTPAGRFRYSGQVGAYAAGHPVTTPCLLWGSHKPASISS